jgi:hypothetical protein
MMIDFDDRPGSSDRNPNGLRHTLGDVYLKTTKIGFFLVPEVVDQEEVIPRIVLFLYVVFKPFQAFECLSVQSADETKVLFVLCFLSLLISESLDQVSWDCDLGLLTCKGINDCAENHVHQDKVDNYERQQIVDPPEEIKIRVVADVDNYISDSSTASWTLNIRLIFRRDRFTKFRFVRKHWKTVLQTFSPI